MTAGPSRQVRQGQFYWIDDGAIQFPENRERTPHTSRGCIVLEGDESLDLGAERILVVPTSSDTSRKDVFDVIIPSPPAPRTDCVALIGHVQPVLRSDLRDLVSRLPDATVDELLAAIVGLLGLALDP